MAITGEKLRPEATKPLMLKPAYTIERGRVVAVSGGQVVYADITTNTLAVGISSDRFTVNDYVSIWNENNIVFVEVGENVSLNDDLTFGASSYDGKLIPIPTSEGLYPCFARANEDATADTNCFSFIKEDTIKVSGTSLLFTDLGGIARKFINDTGAATIKGTVVESSSSTDNAVKVTDLGSIDPIGVILEDGIADGEECWVVYTGVAEILVEDGDAAVLDYWLGCSPTTAGRVYIRVSPPSATEHDREVGHCLEAKASGTDVITKGILHFR